MARVAVVGTGYVGLTVGTCLADLGNDVVCVDIERSRIASLRRGRLPFYEPGLREAIDRNTAAARLRFTTVYEQAIPDAEFVFIAVGTPERPNGEADLRYVASAAASIGRALTAPLVVVNKSTVPIGTADLVAREIAKQQKEIDIDVVSNPEFMREGSALMDFMQPDRVVIGASNRAVAERVAKLYEPLGAPVLITSVHTAEMIKYASNALLATRVSFINEIARIVERLDADIKVVAEGVGLDKRIGQQFLEAGLGFGGSCLPKDLQALASIARKHGHHPELLRSVIAINDDQPMVAVEKLSECLGTIRGQAIGIWGLAFKPNTDDVREAPSLDIAGALIKKGAIVRAYDPAAGRNVKELLPKIELKRDAYAVAKGADAIVLVTEWNEFRQLDLARVRRTMRRPVFIDGRNVYDPEEMRTLGFVYRGIGRN